MSTPYRGIFNTDRAIRHVAVVVGRKWFGLRNDIERWRPRFTSDAEIPGPLMAAIEAADSGDESGLFEIVFNGEVSPKAPFGPKGFFHRQVDISQILEVGNGISVPTSKFSRRWQDLLMSNDKSA